MTVGISKPHSVHSSHQPETRLFDNWIDPIETRVRKRIRDWIEGLIEAELNAALGAPTMAARRATSLPSEREAIVLAAAPARTPTP